ncbi:Fragile X mental retardation syndrome-related protein 1, partial [Durusdinium trenchii]
AISGSVQIPHDLIEWAKSDEAKALLDEIKEKTLVEAITFASVRPGKADLWVTAMTNDAFRAGKSLLEMHLSFQVEYQRRKKKTDNLENYLQETNAEFERGQRVEFSVPDDLIGLVIGKQGANLNKVK